MQGLPPEFARYIPDILESHAATVASAVLALPMAAALGAVLAFRPRRRGTPPRSAPVIQTQIMLAIVGSVVMLIVGASLARAFAIVGVASLIRYRAKIDDPKDAVVMLASLAVGLACGVELYGLAVFATAFMIVVLGIVESLEPEQKKAFDLKIVGAEPSLRGSVEAILRRYRIAYELRSTGPKELSYETRVPFDVRTDRVANAILMLRPGNQTEVVWEKKKK
ncbi:MAG TPA: MgtC/SapB family protein [Vicinamibacterales bacterium]|nr:MgtC/SapB family protein [Vicinamibacterales bacterium]